MTKPIRILHIVPNMQAGGLETLIINIYGNIDRTKVQFDFLVHYTGNFFYDSEIRQLGGKIYNLSVRNDNDFFKYLKDLDKFFEEHSEYKVVHGHMESLGQFYFKAAKKHRVRVRVAHSHSSATESTIKGRIKSLLLKRYKVFATDYFACSEKAGRYMFGNKKFTVLKNAIIVDNFLYNEDIRNSVRKELNIENKTVIGHAGRFCEHKNHKFLLDIFKEISNIEANAILVLVGAGETFDSVKEQVKKYGKDDKVMFLGVRKDIARLYQAMDCFVFPSLSEGLGIVAIEAQCSGLPVVGSDVIPKEAAITKRFHYMSLKESPKDWAKEVLKVAKSKREAEIDKIREAGYDVKDVAQYLQNFYLDKYSEY
ncbi:MAG: glycosyltransferase family 1 protein [Lachnospiraceae bacterium]